jgi:hypothetical protein
MRTRQHLDLTLPIDAQQRRVIRRIEVQTGDVARLLDKGRIVGQLEAARAMRSNARGAELSVRHVPLILASTAKLRTLQCVCLSGRVCSAPIQ